MKLRIGPLPEDPGFTPEDGGWVRLREPSFGLLVLVAIPLSIVLTVGTMWAWGIVMEARGLDTEFGGVVTLTTVLAIMAGGVALLLAHELLHAIALPGGVLSPATTLGLWPKALTPYVHYDGEMSRNRHLLVGLTPFLSLSIAPIVVGLLLAWAPPWVVAVGAFNAFGSSADVIGAALVAAQAPRAAVVRDRGTETWWRRM